MASPPCGSADSKQSFDLLSLAASVSADCAEPILVSSPFTPPIPPPTLRYSSPFRRPGSHARRVLPFHLDSTICARAGKTVISRLNRRTVRLLPRLSACLLTLRKTERTMLPHRPFRLPTSRAVEVHTLQGQCIMEPHHTPEQYLFYKYISKVKLYMNAI